MVLQMWSHPQRITNSSYQSHSRPLFSLAKQLTISDLNKLLIATFMYRHYRIVYPVCFRDIFVWTMNSTLHGYSTRGSDKLHISYARTVVMRSQLRIAGPKLWPLELRGRPSSGLLPSFMTYLAPSRSGLRVHCGARLCAVSHKALVWARYCTMYILYTSDIPQVCRRAGLATHMYADDIQSYLHSNPQESLQARYVRWRWRSGNLKTGWRWTDWKTQSRQDTVHVDRKEADAGQNKPRGPAFTFSGNEVSVVCERSGCCVGWAFGDGGTDWKHL